MSSRTKKRKWAGSAFTQLEKTQVIFVQDEHDENKQSRCNNETVSSIPSTSNCNKSNPKTPKNTNQLSKVSDLRTTNWIESFAPVDIEDVALHPKKLTELQSWMQHCDAMRSKQPAQLCLLSGPSGCSKTTAAKLMAKKLNYHLQEWINPVDRNVVTELGDQSTDYVGSQIEAFKSFLLRASRYKSLFNAGDKKRMLLVEDFPNALLRDSILFEQILEEYVMYGRSPLLFIVADSKTRSLNIGYNLFTDQLKNKFQINHICFNAIATSFLQKSMKKFCMLMKKPELANSYKVPTQPMVDSIVLSAQGDIRNALINLHFASLKGTNSISIDKLETENHKDCKAKKALSKLKSVGRDESITMMHALGRILNPSYMATGEFIHSPEDITESFTTEPKTLVNLLHANYLSRFSNLEYTVEAADGLSLADNIMKEYREDLLATTALNIAVRSVMVANKAPVKGWMPIRAVKRLPKDSSAQRLPGISSNLFAAEYNTYVRHFQCLQKEQPQF